MLEEEIATVKNDLQSNAQDITPELIYKAVALGLAEGLKQRPWEISLKIVKITISTDGMIAEIRLEKNIGVELSAPTGRRFSMDGKALVLKDKTPDRYDHSYYGYSHYSSSYYHYGDSHSSDKEVAVEGSPMSLFQRQTDKVSFKWRRMGVDDYAVMSQKVEKLLMRQSP